MVPEDHFSSDDEEEDKDRRITRMCFDTKMIEKMSDKRRVPETELSDSEDEGQGRRDQRSYRDRSDSLNRTREKVPITQPLLAETAAEAGPELSQEDTAGLTGTDMDVDEPFEAPEERLDE